MRELQLLPEQGTVCERYGVRPQIPQHHDRLGIAMPTLALNPINGLRTVGLSGTSGWYIFGGAEPSTDDDFYSPLCVRHLRRHCQIAIPYLCLPVGWRFQIDPDGYEDVWYDDSLLNPPE